MVERSKGVRLGKGWCLGYALGDDFAGLQQGLHIGMQGVIFLPEPLGADADCGNGLPFGTEDGRTKTIDARFLLFIVD